MNILLVCGGGASSSFLAQNMIRCAQKEGLDIIIDAIGETEIEDYIDDRDLILIGPHLKYLEEELSEVIHAYHVPYLFIEEEYYAKLDGEHTLKDAIAFIQGGKKDEKIN